MALAFDDVKKQAVPNSGDVENQVYHFITPPPVQHNTLGKLITTRGNSLPA